MTYPAATAAVAAGYPPAYAPAAPPYGRAPAGLPTPQPGAVPPGPLPPPPSTAPGPKRPRTGLFAALVVAAIVVAGLLGGIAGALITLQSDNRPSQANTAQPQAPTPPSAETIRAQNVQLCTAYATINSAMPKPQDNALQVLPGVNGLRLALAENPAASPEIRAAITDVVQSYDALIAAFGKVRPRGMAEPPTYDVAHAEQVLTRAWDTCQLG